MLLCSKVSTSGVVPYDLTSLPLPFFGLGVNGICSSNSSPVELSSSASRSVMSSSAHLTSWLLPYLNGLLMPQSSDRWMKVCIDLPNGRSLMVAVESIGISWHQWIESWTYVISAVTWRARGYPASKVKHRTIIENLSEFFVCIAKKKKRQTQQ